MKDNITASRRYDTETILRRTIRAGMTLREQIYPALQAACYGVFPHFSLIRVRIRVLDTYGHRCAPLLRQAGSVRVQGNGA